MIWHKCNPMLQLVIIFYHPASPRTIKTVARSFSRHPFSSHVLILFKLLKSTAKCFKSFVQICLSYKSWRICLYVLCHRKEHHTEKYWEAFSELTAKEGAAISTCESLRFPERLFESTDWVLAGFAL